jgi:hypothetical protein
LESLRHSFNLFFKEKCKYMMDTSHFLQSLEHGFQLLHYPLSVVKLVALRDPDLDLFSKVGACLSLIR